MKIAILINSMQYSGGTARITANLANVWAKKKYDVTIITTDKDITSFYFLCNNVKVKSLNIESPNRTPFGILKWFISIIFSLVKFAKKEQIDFLLGIWTSMGVCVSVAGIFLECKTIACEHISYQFNKRALKILSKIFYPLADAVVALTEIDKRKLLKINMNSICIPNFIDFDKGISKPKYDVKRVLAVGRLASQKGFDLLLESWENVAKEFPEWKLSIVGDVVEVDDISEKIYSIIQEKNIASVELFPATKNIEEFYLNSSVFVMSSRYEGFPMVLLEAMSLGLPVVSFDCPTGPQDIIRDGVTGILVPYLNTDMLSENLAKLLKDEDLRRTMGTAASQDVYYRYGKEVIMQKWARLFEQLNNK